MGTGQHWRVPGNMMWFLNYEMVKLFLKDWIPHDLAVSMIAGASAGIGYWTLGFVSFLGFI